MMNTISVSDTIWIDNRSFLVLRLNYDDVHTRVCQQPPDLEVVVVIDKGIT